MHDARNCTDELLGLLQIRGTPSAGYAGRELLCAGFSQASSHPQASAAHPSGAIPGSRVSLSQSGTKPSGMCSAAGQSDGALSSRARQGAARQQGRVPPCVMRAAQDTSRQCRSRQGCSVDVQLSRRGKQRSCAVPAPVTRPHTLWPLLPARQGAALPPSSSPQHPQAQRLQHSLQRC